MATTSDLKVGVFIRFNGELYNIEEVMHRTPGNLRAFYQAKMRNVRSGRVLENRFRSGEEIELVRIERKTYQYLFHDGQSYHFMDQETYEQMPIDEAIIGEGAGFLKEGVVVEVMFDGHDPVGAEMPYNVELKVIDTVPGVRGDTANPGTKPAKVETGATVNVPLFINAGDIVRVDTRTGQYLERVKQ